MGDLVATVLPVVGVAAGVALSWGTTTLTERTRFRRQRATWLQEQKLQAAVEYAVAAKGPMSLLYRVAAHQGWDDQLDPLTMADAEPLLAAAYHRREEATERICLVAAPHVFEAAQRWARAVHKMREAFKEPTTDKVKWKGLVDAANTQRHAFYESANRDRHV